MTSVAAPTPPLRAVTRPLDHAPDLLDAVTPDGFAFVRGDAGFVAAGVAARVHVDDAEAILGSVEVDDPLGEPATGALAVGALGFDPDAPGLLTIPQVVIGRDGAGGGWITEIGDPAGRLRVPTWADEPTSWEIVSRVERPAWRSQVDAALAAIGQGELTKVVLSRAVTVDADRPFVVPPIVRRLRDGQPGCVVYYADGLVGASPELLVRRAGTCVESQPLAGTARGVGGVEALRRSPKDAHEHQVVVDDIVDVLGPRCEHLSVSEGPEPLRFGPLVHLATGLRGELRAPAASALTLVRALHPTPAVAGTPREAALRAVAALEGDDRGRYAGPVGWVDGRGDGEWVVALRGAELDGTRAVLRAGAGIVAGSDPDAEWAETQAKLEPMLRALVCP